VAFHLAQFNVAHAKYPINDPQMKGFVDLLASVNEAGERSKGFVWILKDDTGTAVNYNPYNDPYLLVNMTVWETIEDLKNFAYSGAHGDIFRRRREWFQPMEKESTVLWWIAKGSLPTVEEGKAKLNQLWENGPTAEAFSLKKIFQP